jgi:hypothetical protein
MDLLICTNRDSLCSATVPRLRLPSVRRPRLVRRPTLHEMPSAVVLALGSVTAVAATSCAVSLRRQSRASRCPLGSDPKP